MTMSFVGLYVLELHIEYSVYTLATLNALGGSEIIQSNS